MAAIIPCKKIGLKAHRLQKKSTNNRSIKPTGFPLLKSDQHPGRPLSFQNSGIETDLDHQLQTLENRARQRYLDIYKTLSFEELPEWLDGMLDQSVMPTLQRIGFDVPVSKALFEMALASWKLLGPLNEKIIAFHPAIYKEIEEVRQGLKLKTCDSSDMIPRSQSTPNTSIPGTINEDVSPENLFDLFDEIGTPWIILPRASGFLRKHHCHYLPAYLKTIDQESSSSCLKLFSRITVEFLGNFSLKFADIHHPPQKLTKLLFYGYSALFWRNLMYPPYGSPGNLENGAAFDHFFNWIKRLAGKSEFLGVEENNIIDQMINLKTKVFPSSSAIRS
jgi:hypothetical protein